jgi:hypothetical protein
VAAAIEDVLDRAARRDRNPGARPAPRLNRAEYEAAIKELLALEVNAGNWLPQDEKSANFDNIAEAQIISPLLVEAYLNAASEITRLAVGDRNAARVKRTYTNSDYISQHPWDHVPGAPYGTRGGIVADHVFPADGYYTFQMTFRVDGNTRLEDIDVSIDGVRVALVHYDRGVLTGGGFNAQDLSGGLSTERVFVRAGQHQVSAAFVRLLRFRTCGILSSRAPSRSPASRTPRVVKRCSAAVPLGPVRHGRALWRRCPDSPRTLTAAP